MTVKQRTDEEVKMDIMEQMYCDGRINVSQICAEVSDGKVTLSGVVHDQLERRAAEENAWLIPGVKYIVNNIQVEPPANVSMPNDARIQTELESLVMTHPDMEPVNVEIVVDSGRAILKGSVDAYWKKIKIEQLAISHKHVKSVVNEIAVVPTEDFDDQNLADNIIAELELKNILLGTIDLMVEEGKVTLTGSVSSLPMLQRVMETVENTSGVIMIINELAIR